MKVELKVTNDSMFTMGELPPLNGEVNLTVEAEEVQEVIETPPSPPSIPEANPGAAPLYNHRSGGMGNLFEGTSWGTNHQRPTDIGR